MKLTLQSLLFADPDASGPGELGPSLVGDALSGVSSSLRAAASDEVGRSLDGLLAMDVFDVLAAGWRQHRALTAAAERTGAAPGTRELVELATHTVAASYEPYIDVLVNEQRVGRIVLDLDISATAHALCGVVEAGRLVELRSGRVAVSASLSAEDVELAAGERTVDIDATVTIRPPDVQ